MTKVEVFGISKTKYAIDNAFDILQNLLDTFGDGVQVWDLKAMPGLGKDFYDIAKVYDEVKKEASDYSPIEVKEIIDSYGERAIELFWTNQGDDYYGIENLKVMINAINELLILVINNSSDGITLEDLDAVPEIRDIIQTAISVAPEAKKEMYELNASEIALLGSDIAMRVLLLIKS